MIIPFWLEGSGQQLVYPVFKIVSFFLRRPTMDAASMFTYIGGGGHSQCIMEQYNVFGSEVTSLRSTLPAPDKFYWFGYIYITYNLK